MFSIKDRGDILDYITSTAEGCEHIVALVAVGSGAYGYIDELSDLDFVIAIDKYENLDTVRNYVAEMLKKRAGFIYFKQSPNIPLQVYMLDNFLEIDIGYGEYTRAAASREHWKVLFDKSGTVDKAMRDSWEKQTSKPRTEDYSRKLAECADRAWHNLMHCAVAIKRGQPLRALSELGVARDLLSELYGLRYSLEIERGRDLDKLPEREKDVLKRTFAGDLSEEALWESLACLTDAVYSELESGGDSAQIRVDRKRVNEYINACRER